MNLRELQEKLASREALEAELASLNQQANELSGRLHREKVNLEYEQSDVEALEGNTLKSLFYTVIGKKEERLMKEEDEAEEAKRQYEGTVAELDKVNARIKRVEIDLQNLKWAERNYQNQVKDLSARIEEIKTRMTDADARDFELIQRELAEQTKKQALYAQITEACEELQKRIAWVAEAQREVEEEREKTSARNALSGVHVSYSRAEEERRREAKERQTLVAIQAKRIGALIDPENDSTTANGTLPKDKLARLGINVVGNISDILEEVKQRLQVSKRHQAELELKLSELLQKYQTV